MTTSERLTRSELNATYRLAACLSELNYTKDDCKNVLERIESADQLNTVIENMSDILRKIVMAAPDNQQRQIRNLINDYKVEIVPRLKPSNPNVLMTKEQAKNLIELAQERCHGCVESGKNIEKCALFKLLETLLPLDSYDTFVCPYALAEWE